MGCVKAKMTYKCEGSMNEWLNFYFHHSLASWYYYWCVTERYGTHGQNRCTKYSNIHGKFLVRCKVSAARLAPPPMALLFPLSRGSKGRTSAADKMHVVEVQTSTCQIQYGMQHCLCGTAQSAWSPPVIRCCSTTSCFRKRWISS